MKVLIILILLLFEATAEESEINVVCIHELVYRCELQNFEVDDRETEVVLYVSTNGNFTPEDVTEIFGSAQTIFYFPTVFFEYFENLESVSLNFFNMVEMEEPLFNCQKLEYLNIENNKLTNLGENVLQDCINLETLILSFNQFTTFDDTAFNGLNRLSTIYLSHNLITSLTPNLFVQNSALNYLDVGSNSLQELPTFLFANLTSPKYLILENNQISELKFNRGGDSFYELRPITTLRGKFEAFTKTRDFS
jgi:Leucine-rich repeat (LRR) protein